MTQNQDQDRWFKVTLVAGSLTFLLFIPILIISALELYPESFTTFRAIIIMSVITIFTFTLPFITILSAYAISKDKRLRHKNGYNSNPRHTLTILTFFYFSGLLYLLYYIFARHNSSKIADDPPNTEKPEDRWKSSNQLGGDGSKTSNGDSGVPVSSEELKSGSSTASESKTNQALNQGPESQEGSSETNPDQTEPSTHTDTNTADSEPIGGETAETALKYCTQCGAEMPADGAFCTECGNELL